MIHVDQAIVEVDLSLPSSRPFETIVVRVVDADGEPVTDSEVFVHLRYGPDYWRTTSVEFNEPRAGEHVAQLTQSLSERLFRNSPLDCIITVSSEALGVQVVPLVSDETVIQFQNNATLDLTIVDSVSLTEDDLDQITLLPRSQGYSLYDLVHDRYGPDLSTRDSYEAGPYVLQGYIDDQVVIGVPVDLRPGSNSVTVRLPDAARLQVNFPKLQISRSELKLVPAQNPLRTRTATLDEETLFEAVAHGEYFLHSAELGYMHVAVDSDKSIEFTPAPVSALRLVCPDPRWTEQFNIRNGDVFREVAGTTFATGAEFHQAFKAAIAGPRPNFTIERSDSCCRLRFPKSFARPHAFRSSCCSYPTRTKRPSSRYVHDR